MGTYEHWPYSNLHDLNLDWVLQIIGDFKRQYENLTEYFNGLIAQLDEKTQEEIAEFDEAISGYEITLRELVSQLEGDLVDTKNDCITDLTTTRNNYMVTLQTVGNEELVSIQNRGIEVINSIPVDYSTLENSAIKNIGNGAPDTPTPVVTDLNDVYYTDQNAMYSFHPGYTYTNTPTGSISSDDYHIKLINSKDVYAYEGASDVSRSCMQIFYAIKYNDPTVTLVYARTVYLTYIGGVVSVNPMAWHLM